VKQCLNGHRTVPVCIQGCRVHLKNTSDDRGQVGGQSFESGRPGGIVAPDAPDGSAKARRGSEPEKVSASHDVDPLFEAARNLV
jgi:hypothetical protein